VFLILLMCSHSGCRRTAGAPTKWEKAPPTQSYWLYDEEEQRTPAPVAARRQQKGPRPLGHGPFSTEQILLGFVRDHPQLDLRFHIAVELEPDRVHAERLDGFRQQHGLAVDLVTRFMQLGGDVLGLDRPVQLLAFVYLGGDGQRHALQRLGQRLERRLLTLETDLRLGA